MKQMLTVLIIGLFSSAFAQDTPPLIVEENPDLAAQVDYILENLNMSSITTNLLLDRGFKMNDISNFTGTRSAAFAMLWNPLLSIYVVGEYSF